MMVDSTSSMTFSLRELFVGSWMFVFAIGFVVWINFYAYGLSYDLFGSWNIDLSRTLANDYGLDAGFVARYVVMGLSILPGSSILAINCFCLGLVGSRPANLMAWVVIAAVPVALFVVDCVISWEAAFLVSLRLLSVLGAAVCAVAWIGGGIAGRRLSLHASTPQKLRTLCISLHVVLHVILGTCGWLDIRAGFLDN